jgi:hypothetical protein
MSKAMLNYPLTPSLLFDNVSCCHSPEDPLLWIMPEPERANPGATKNNVKRGTANVEQK